MKKRINSYIYTLGKFGKGYREIADTDNPYLYSWGRYPTKIKEEDLPEDFLKIRSRSLWYMFGYIKTSGIVDIGYTWCKENHLFKDDYIYISYNNKLVKHTDKYGLVDYDNYDICISGNDIVRIVLWAEKYSKVNTKKVRKEIENKRVWLKNNEKEYYKECVGEDKNIFDLWIEKGYIKLP